MTELTKSQKGRIAIRIFRTMAEALMLRGYYKPSGKSGQTLMEALKILSPEIYGTMNDPRIIELKGLEYIIERLPRGIESCTRIILTAQEDFTDTSFEKIVPSKRRRISYRLSPTEMCFVITRGLSEIFDILTHLTFMINESLKIRQARYRQDQTFTEEWSILEECVKRSEPPDKIELDKQLWNLSMILGRTFHETKETYLFLEDSRQKSDSNEGLFKIIHSLGNQVSNEESVKDESMIVYFTPALQDMIGNQKYGRIWAMTIKDHLHNLELDKRPLHIISANMHSVSNVLYGYELLYSKKKGKHSEEKQDINDLPQYFQMLREKSPDIKRFALKHGLHEFKDESGANIDCQIIDMDKLTSITFHPALGLQDDSRNSENPVLLIMDYAFGTQAFEVMDELLSPREDGLDGLLNVKSISVMGKAGTLVGRKRDIMIATAHVLEGTPHNYIIRNDLDRSDFDDTLPVHVGPILTVLGTSLQNRDVLERFSTSSWKAVGLEMEGGHYQQAINAAIIRGHISPDVKLRYVYYASDNPLESGQTLSAGSMGEEGVLPTYLITKVILEKILK